MPRSACRALLAAGAVVAALTVADYAFVSPGQVPRPPAERMAQKASAFAREVAEPAEAQPNLDAFSSAWRFAAAAAVALLVALVPLEGAEAARSGGRMGGMGGGFSRRSAPPRIAAPRAAPSGGSRFAGARGPNINVGVGSFAPPIFMPSPFGFGSPFGYGLFGPPMLPLGMNSGPSQQDQITKDQQRQDERVIDQEKMQIDQMQREIQDLKAKKQ
mmetsp:Transcript_60137/g.157634  ORF Transcript_60137/g.157634 Transcript_60137/m.157634 type:complete len:216 (-) Transcript_60137:5-652(-)